MKITICGSIAFYDEMLKVRPQLEKRAHQVELPPSKVKDDKGKDINVKDYYQIRQNTNKNST